MATQLFLRATSSGAPYSTGNNDANLIGTATGWTPARLMTSRGAAGAVDISASTVTGATNGVEVGPNYAWYSDPLDAAITISGSITWNIWASEDNMSANVAINGRLEKVDGATGAFTLIDQTARTAEVAVTTNAVNNFAETPASGVACKKGDRLRVRIFGDDAGAMASGFTFKIGIAGADAGLNGDTYLTLTETLSFASEPAGSQVFLTDAASAVSTASVDREAWTSRGAGVQTDVTNTVNGYTSPLQVTDTAGGTVVDWFTKQLAAFTLGGAVRCNIRGLESNAAANAALKVEVARVASDGTSPTVWAVGMGAADAALELGTTEAVRSFLISGDDLAISDGQRLRIRVSVDDYGLLGAAMVTGHTVTTYYAGTSGGASGDTYLTFSQTLTEYSANATGTFAMSTNPVT